MGGPHREFKVEALRNQKLQLEYVICLRLRNMIGVCLQRNRVVSRFRREKQRRQPRNEKYATHDVRGTEQKCEGATHTHHILGVPVHDCVFQVETLHVADRARLDFFRKVEEAT